MSETTGTETRSAPNSDEIERCAYGRARTDLADWLFSLPGIFLLFASFFLIAYAVFHHGFHSRMVYDSESLILGNESTFARHNLLEVIGIVPQRPLFMLSLFVNYLFTGVDPFFFRLFNAGILAAAGVALALLIAAILEAPALETFGTAMDKATVHREGDNASESQWGGVLEKRGVAVGLALLFVVHPVQCFGVLYIWQRAAVMACLFSFASLAAYVTARTGGRLQPRTAYVLCSVLFLAGMLSKENLVTLPLVMIVVEIILFRQNFTELIRRASVIAALVVPPIVLQIVLTHVLYGAETSVDQQGVVQRVWLYYHKAGLTPLEVVLTQCRVAFSYLSLIVDPYLQEAQLLRAETISRSLWNPPVTSAAVAGVIGLMATAAWLRTRAPAASLGVVFFFIGIAPESLLIPQYLFYAHRAILPMAGVLLVLAQGSMALLTWANRRGLRLAVYGPMIAMVVCTGVVSHSEARQWNPESLWKRAFDELPTYSPDVEKFPYQDVLVGYGTELCRSGKFPPAIKLLKEAMEVDADPKNEKTVLAAGNLGMALFQTGHREEGVGYLRRAVELSPRGSWARHNLGIALLNSGKTQDGIHQLKEAAKLNPADLQVRLDLGDYLRESGKVSEAAELYEQARQLAPRSAVVHNRLAVTREKSGNLPLALESYRKAVSLSPDSAELQFNLAKALAASGNIEEAIETYRRAVQLNPEFGPARANLGTLLLRTGRVEEAIVSLQKALAIVGDNAELLNQLGMALSASGRTGEARAAFHKALALKPDHAAARQNLDKLPHESQGQAGR